MVESFLNHMKNFGFNLNRIRSHWRELGRGLHDLMRFSRITLTTVSESIVGEPWWNQRTGGHYYIEARDFSGLSRGGRRNCTLDILKL